MSKWPWKLTKRHINEEHWELHSEVINHSYFNKLMKTVGPMCRERSGKRMSCLFGNFHYEGVPSNNWSDAPPCLIKLVMEVQNILKVEFEYCLVHIYLDGQSYIGWHNDKEASNTMIASLSLGAPRKFRFRKMGKGDSKSTIYDYQYILRSGDLLVMKEGCQRKWEHCVPKELTVKHPRINITFRLKNERSI